MHSDRIPPFTQSSNLLFGTLQAPSSGFSSGPSPQSLDAVGPRFVPAQLQSYSFLLGASGRAKRGLRPKPMPERR